MLEAETRQDSFKEALSNMPDVGDDADFVVTRDLPRDVS